MRLPIAILAAAVLLLAGCGGKAVTPQMATPIPHAKTFTSRELRFAITYDAAKLKVEIDTFDSDITSKGGFITVDFVDRNRSDSPRPWLVRGTMRVFAQQMYLPRQASPPPLAAVRKTLTEHFEGHPTMSILGAKDMQVSAVQPVTLNGLSGYRAWYTWGGGRAVHYSLYKGLYIYEIDVTVAKKVWPSIWPTYNTALHSLTVIP